MRGMATTDTFTTRSLSEYDADGYGPQSRHSWEHDHRGLTVEHDYTLNHVDETCPDYRAAADVGLAYVEGELSTGWPCSTCWVDGGRARDAAGPNGDQRDSIDAPTGSGGPHASGGEPPASDKQVRFLTALVRGSVSRTPEWLDGTLSADDAEGIVWVVAVEVAGSKRRASAAIDKLQASGCSPVWDALVRTAPAAAAEPQPVAAPARTNRYAATCTDCGVEVPAETGSLTKSAAGRWEVRHHGGCPDAAPAPADVDGIDLSELPAGRYAVPGGDTRLKLQVDRPTEGRWAGYIFVRDAAEYGSGQRYGRQQPGSLYSGAVVEPLRAILADPAAASAAYGRLVGRCGVCSRRLEDEQSVERGIGPVCAQRLGW